jgi:hypothetical protein
VGFSQYEEFLTRELPRRVRRELELAVEKELEPIEDRLKSKLVDIVCTCQEKLFREYQKPRESTQSTHPRLQFSLGPLDHRQALKLGKD